jgi:hypothetical protein
MKLQLILLFIMLFGAFTLSISQTATMNTATFQLSPYPFSGTSREQMTKTKFRSDDDIYGKISLPSTVEQYFDLSGTGPHFLSYTVTVSRDGKKLATNNWTWLHVSDNERGKQYLIVDIMPAPINTACTLFQNNDLTSGFTSASIGWLLGSLKTTTGLLQFTVRISNSGYAIETSFEIDYDEKHLSRIVSKTMAAEESVKSQTASFAKPSTTGLPFEWFMKSELPCSGLTQQQLTNIINAKLGPDGKIIRTIIQPTIYCQWQTENDEISRRTRKYHHQTIFVFKEENGRYSFFEGYLQQDYTGDNFGEVYFNLTRSGEYANSKPFRTAVNQGDPKK